MNKPLQPSTFNLQPLIAIIGDYMIDHYLGGKSDRISPEAPVPVVEVIKEEDRLGGAGNVVNNLLALGANVLVSGVLGKNSDRLLKLLKDKKEYDKMSKAINPYGNENTSKKIVEIIKNVS